MLIYSILHCPTAPLLHCPTAPFSPAALPPCSYSLLLHSSISPLPPAPLLLCSSATLLHHSSFLLRFIFICTEKNTASITTSSSSERASRSSQGANPFSPITSFNRNVDIDQPTEKINARNPTARNPSFQSPSCQRLVNSQTAATV